LNKPKPSKRKLPAKRNPVTTKRHKKETFSQNDDVREQDDLHENWEPVPVNNTVLDPVESDPWDSFDPKQCKLPPAWYWLPSNDDLMVITLITFPSYNC